MVRWQQCVTIVATGGPRKHLPCASMAVRLCLTIASDVDTRDDSLPVPTVTPMRKSGPVMHVGRFGTHGRGGRCLQLATAAAAICGTVNGTSAARQPGADVALGVHWQRPRHQPAAASGAAIVDGRMGLHEVGWPGADTHVPMHAPRMCVWKGPRSAGRGGVAMDCEGGRPDSYVQGVGVRIFGRHSST